MKKRLLPIFAVLLLLIALLTTVGCDKKEVPIERIAVTSLPRLEYLKGQTFDLNNAKLTVYYADGTSKTIPLTYEMISEYNPQRLGSIFFGQIRKRFHQHKNKDFQRSYR